MIDLYLYDQQGIFTWQAKADPFNAVPANATLVSPPQTTGTEVAQWTGAGWQVLPVAPEPPPAIDPDKAALDAYMDLFRTLRLDLLNAMSGIALRAFIAGDTVIPAAYATASKALLDIPQLPAVANAKTRDEAENAVKAEYARIVSQTPDALRAAFKEIQP